MASESPRDQSIEHLLRQGVGQARVTRDSPKCLDAEALAAWSSGALQHGAAARVEEHLADCERCQAMVATFLRTDAPVAVPSPWWKRWEVRWLVPIATAATVAAIWVAIPDRDLAVREMPQVSQVAGEEPSPVAPQRDAAQAPPGMPIDQSATAKRESARQGSAANAAEQRAKQRPEGSARTPRRDQASEPVARGPVAAAPPPTAAPMAAPSMPAGNVTTLAESIAVARQLPAAVVRSGSVVIRSPDGATLWQITPEGTIERSTTGGATWERITLPSPAVLTSGHSPATPIVWLVGRSGAIFVAIDGTRFERVPFIESVDLASVVAVDERQATVTTADGRRFSTTNRGETWRLQ